VRRHFFKHLRLLWKFFSKSEFFFFFLGERLCRGGRSAQKSEKTTKEEAEIDQNRAFHAPVVDFRGDRAEKRIRGDALGSNTPRALRFGRTKRVFSSCNGRALFF